MFRRALADGIGKCCGAANRECDVFDFDEAATVATFQTKVEPAVSVDFDFPSNGFVSA